MGLALEVTVVWSLRNDWVRVLAQVPPSSSPESSQDQGPYL